ncbi:peptide chain release factor 2 [Clostridium sp. D2Q-11]|uniref:Peptide chain release factor 2 n=1 Tax=Anaeromonas frigoriresistens TaxID=2683708 RepID=A0A942UUA6_9FIRM|nr:peptide chain release factor 2 [Anaeromonas frigoriresistens]MBS4538125.1 peptide chain release factor 2 [Anaeromonas frigoriresistens]
MLELEKYNGVVDSFRKRLDEVGVSLDLSSLKDKFKELEKEMSQPDFWNDNNRAQDIIQRSNVIKEKIDEHESLSDEIDDLEVLLVLAEEEQDKTLLEDIEEKTKEIDNRLDEFRIKTLLSGEYDNNSAILSINSGAGGLEAQDWAEMLLRMYSRWAERKGYKLSTLDILPDTEAGIKSVTLSIKGENAYGYLKSEKGVHRLVRISPFDSSGRRHTSFASVDIMPELDDDLDIDINTSDLRIDTYRASGAGGQHVNTTDSAIRITHVPTGVVVQCQSERSQHKNKATAMKMLQGKLIELKEMEQKEKIEDIQGNYNQISWGSQIRSYVFHPYNLVKDHRTNVEEGNTDKVMDGDIDKFINAYLKYKAMK